MEDCFNFLTKKGKEFRLYAKIFAIISFLIFRFVFPTFISDEKKNEFPEDCMKKRKKKSCTPKWSELKRRKCDVFFFLL